MILLEQEILQLNIPLPVKIEYMKKNKNELQFFTIWIANIKVKKREITTYEFID